MTATTATAKTAANKESKMTATKTATKNPASDPKPAVKRTRKPAAAKVEPEHTPEELAKLAKGSLPVVKRAETLAKNATIDFNDQRSVDRAQHLWAKVREAMERANKRHIDAGLPAPFDPAAAQAPEPEPEHDDNITLINRADGSVDGHRAGCADIARIVKRERTVEPWTAYWPSKRAAFLDYNMDFINENEDDEDPEANTYHINWLPCANKVPSGVAPVATEPKSAPSEPFPTKAAKASRAGVATAAATKKTAATTSKPSAAVTATPKPARVVPSPSDKSAAKAKDLADYAATVGWTATIADYQTTGKHVALAKGDEEMAAWFTDGKLDLEMRPFYKNAARPRPVLLRNVSAMRQQMAEDEASRPVARETTRVARTANAGNDKPRKSFAWDNELDDAALLDSLQNSMTGKRITWRIKSDIGTEEMEVLVGKVMRTSTTPQNDRAVDFFEMEITKDGIKMGKQRTLLLNAILRLI